MLLADVMIARCRYHYTDLDSAKLVVDSIGLRASNVGQLGGGVSICLTSPVEMGWCKYGEGSFPEAVGKALWGSKWYEVMPGEPWPDLQQQISSGRVKGSWPAARDHWGSWKKKLEAVFVVKIPSKENRDPRRLVPGRDDVFIVPKSDCVPDENGEYAFLPNERIISCFILKAPDEPGRDTLARLSRDATGDNVPQRVVVSSARDGNGGMEGVFLTELEPEATAVDHESVDGSSGFPPKVLACVTSVAEQLTKVDLAAMQRAIEQAAVGKQLWPEDVGRFTTEEMEFALYALDQALLRPYSLAYYYTSKADAQAICEPGGGIKASAERGTVVLCTKSPIALGWEQHGRGSFRSNVGQLLWQARPTDVYAGGQYANRLEVLVLVAVPTAVLEDRSNHLKGSALCTIPSTLLTEAGGLLNAHIQKVYELGAAPPASAIEPATLPSNEIASSRGGTPPRSRKPPPPQLPVAQVGATVGAVVALNTMTFGGARGGPPSDVEVGSGANLVANPLSLLPEAPEASHSMVIEVSAATASNPISQEELAIYLECIAEAESMDDIVELCNDAELAIPEESTMETLQELLSAHYISSAQAVDSVEQLHHERLASEPRPVPTRPVPARPVPTRPVPTRPVVQFEPGAQMIAVKRHPVRKSHKANADHVATLDVGDSFTIVGVEITAGGTKLQIEAHIGSAKKKGKTKTKRGWISPLDRAGHPTVKPAPVLKLETDNPVFEVD
jgi:hypothetical protein